MTMYVGEKRRKEEGEEWTDKGDRKEEGNDRIVGKERKKQTKT